MKGKRLLASAVVLLLLLVVMVGLSQAMGQEGRKSAAPQAIVGSAFTFQGTLERASRPANGIHNMRFALYDASNGGQRMGNAIIRDVSVNNGQLDIELDFGDVFDGTRVWLQVSIFSHYDEFNDPVYIPLDPRYEIRPVPYALSLRPGAKIVGDIAEPVLSITNTTGGPALYVDGDVVQSRTGDGVVKAGAYVNVVIEDYHLNPTISRFFNNVGETITATAASEYINLDFGFDLSDRYWNTSIVAGEGRNTHVVCRVENITWLSCYFDTLQSSGPAGAFIVLVY